MPKAAFSIINYYFDKVNVDMDNKPANNELSISFDTTGVFKSQESNYEIKFVVEVINNEQKPLVKIQCRGVFKINDVHSGPEIPDFFYNNSIAILFPYVRSYISIVTTQANLPGIILPTLNLSSLGEKLKKNTKIE